MKLLKNIYLIGPMGAGKTSVGKHLAKLAKLRFYDSDQEIEKLTGVDISWIFQMESEQGFREREKEMIEKLTQLDGIVLSTGGGAVVTAKNRQYLSDNGVIVYLKVSLDEQFERTQRRKEGKRPMIETDNPYESLKQLNTEREPIYESIAHLVYSTDKLVPRSIAAKILKDIKKLP